MNTYEMEELIPLVAEMTQEYTSKESSSIPYEKARQFMQAVIYTINQMENYDPGQKNVSTKESMPVWEAYHLGRKKLEDKTKKAHAIYEELTGTEFISFGNLNMEDTIQKGMPAFFLHYDLRFAPMDTILSLDYPLIEKKSNYTGIDRILEYLEKIKIEQDFFRRIPETYSKQVLENYEADYRNGYDNLARPLIRNLLLHSLMKQKRLDPFFSEGKKMLLQDTLNKMDAEEVEKYFYVTEKAGLDKKAYLYFREDVPDFVTELQNTRALSLYV